MAQNINQGSTGQQQQRGSQPNQNRQNQNQSGVGTQGRDNIKSNQGQRASGNLGQQSSQDRE